MTNLDNIFKADVTLPTKVHLVKAMVFPVVMYGCESWTAKKVSTEELMLLNCGVGEDFWESLGLQGDPTSPFERKSVLNIHWRTDVEAETTVLWPPDAKSWLIWKDPDVGKDWRQKENDRGRDGLMASPTRWTWVWVNSGSWWWTGRPGMLQFMGSQRVRHDWATELNWCPSTATCSPTPTTC